MFIAICTLIGGGANFVARKWKIKIINYRWNPSGDYQAWRGDQQVQELF